MGVAKTRTFWRELVEIVQFGLVGLKPVFDAVYWALFGWIDRRVARQNTEALRVDVEAAFGSLFRDRGAVFVANRPDDCEPAFDYAKVTVAVAGGQLEVWRCRGDVDVRFLQGGEKVFSCLGLDLWKLAAEFEQFLPRL